MWCVVFLQCSEIGSDCFEFFQSQFGNPRISRIMQATLNVSSGIVSHALEFGTNKSLEQVGIDISAPCTRESKNKFGSKCESFAADMSSRMSAPGIPCSKKTVLRIGFMMDHHRDY